MEPGLRARRGACMEGALCVCKAVLKFGKRFDLNGEPVDQTVEAPREKTGAVAARRDEGAHGSAETECRRRAERHAGGGREDRRK